ncbi:MAG: TRAP transporter large permease subunit [Burkholderiaceae bacterium]|nr:TRAP transporter large permease subunit [Burkholderiaceae bacterium]
MMAIIAFAAVFGWLLAWQNVPEAIAASITGITARKYVFLAIVIAFILLLGLVMEVQAIATIFGPLLNTLAIGYGFDPVYFGVLLAILMQIGGITPPVGILLNITCGLADVKPGQCLGYIGIFVAVMTLVVVLAILLPPLIAFLPSVLI